MDKKRPVIITIFCILGFLGAAISILMVFTLGYRAIGAWYPPYVALSTLVGLVGWIGVWMMKKWGVLLYSAFFVVNQVVLLAMHIWSISSLAALVAIAVIFSQFSKMD